MEKYRIGVIHDVAAYLDTLERVKQMSARTFVPAHADAAQDIAPLAQYNIDQVHQVAEDILALCQEPVQFETILQNLFTGYGLELTLEQYVLVGSTVRSYLAWLVDGGQVTYGFDQNRLLWERA